MKLGTRLVAVTAALVVGIIVAIVVAWTTTEKRRMYREQRDDALATAETMSNLMINLVDDHNWSQIRVELALIVSDKVNPEIAYIVVHADDQDDRIVASEPPEFGERVDFYPDLVPLEMTRRAIAATDDLDDDTFMLRDVTMPNTIRPRVRRGQHVIEVAVPIRIVAGKRVGVLRVGRSLDKIDEAVRDAQRTALLIGGIALAIALAGAWLLGRTLVRPIEKLALDAKMIAAGDLGHHVDIQRTDEIGALAAAFNNMSHDLAASFGKLRDTAASFQRFVPQKFLAVVAPEGLDKIKIGTASPRRIAVLFSDIRGFTKMSEQMTPAEVFELLNVYLARMGAAIDDAGGFVDKYIGDAIMALFDDEHTDGLLRAIIGMREALAVLNRERQAQGKPPIESGIGAHGGDVVMGTIGFASKIESTVIGDPVNVGSRVEGMTKDYKVSLLITGEVVARLSDRSKFPLRLLAEKVNVRGRVDPVDLYTLDV